MRRRSVLAAVVTAALTAALLWPVWPALSLESAGSRLGYVPIDPGEGFTVSFTHSIDGLPVHDSYVIRDGQVVQDATRVQSFGAGMGHIPGQGTGHAEGRWWVVSGIDRPIGDLAVRVGSPAADHRLTHPGGQIPLSVCWAGERVTLRPARISTLVRILSATRPPTCAAALEESARGEGR